MVESHVPDEGSESQRRIHETEMEFQGWQRRGWRPLYLTGARMRERHEAARSERAGGGEGWQGRGLARGTQGTHGRAGWMGAGTVFKRKEKERGESSEWLVHY